MRNLRLSRRTMLRGALATGATLTLPLPVLDGLLAQDSALGSAALSLLLARQRETEDRIESLLFRNVEGRLASQGRLLVRYSGTEPLLRIMLEGQHESEIRAWAEEIAAAVKTHLA